MVDPGRLKRYIAVKKWQNSQRRAKQQEKLDNRRLRYSKGRHDKRINVDVSGLQLVEKIQLEQDCAIVTAANSGYFIGLQLLCMSIQAKHNVPIIVFDIGLDHSQVTWCTAMGCTVVSAKNLPLIYSRPGWRTANKPVYISKAAELGYQRVLWIDSDCVVLSDLTPIFNKLNFAPFVTADTTVTSPESANVLKNRDFLYKMMPTPFRWKNQPFINAGVVGFHVERDKAILNSWKWVIGKANSHKLVRMGLAFGDQGALIWALEKNAFLQAEPDWNQYSNMRPSTPQKMVNELLQSSHNILHFIGKEKPWDIWQLPRLSFVQGRAPINFADDFAFYISGWEVVNKGLRVPRTVAGCVQFQHTNNRDARLQFYQPLLDMPPPQKDFIGFFISENLDSSKLNRFKRRYRKVQAIAHDTNNYAGLTSEIKTEICELLGAAVDVTRPTVSANFVCEKAVFLDLRRKWKMVYLYLYNKYTETLNYPLIAKYIVAMYFRSRPDLRIELV